LHLFFLSFFIHFIFPASLYCLEWFFWGHLAFYYLRIENAEGYVLIAVYLFIYLYACYSQNTKSIKPNRMKFGGMIGYYPGTI